ncbi:unnamed protein product [Lactuca virosa]|uniref:Uncharacterized protein n=1 Tax=Lactuca virosa TaxID=75947 RepID=A0AAU9LLQ2_9ASTR|nr:unnamed protein product [Lactuca virosa]
MRSCITYVTGMLSDIIETWDSMITITMHKHLVEKLRPVFAMIHSLEGVSDQSLNQKQGEKVCLVGQGKKNPKLQLNLLSRKNLSARKNCLVKNPSLITVQTKRSWTNTSLKGERLVKPNWMSTSGSSERLKKRK